MSAACSRLLLLLLSHQAHSYWAKFSNQKNDLNMLVQSRAFLQRIIIIYWRHEQEAKKIAIFMHTLQSKWVGAMKKRSEMENGMQANMSQCIWNESKYFAEKYDIIWIFDGEKMRSDMLFGWILKLLLFSWELCLSNKQFRFALILPIFFAWTHFKHVRPTVRIQLLPTTCSIYESRKFCIFRFFFQYKIRWSCTLKASWSVNCII